MLKGVVEDGTGTQAGLSDREVPLDALARTIVQLV